MTRLAIHAMVWSIVPIVGCSEGKSTVDPGFNCALTIPPEARKIADFLVNLMDENGAMPDGPGGDRCNEDSTMEYALIGLGHAYACLQEPAYLDHLQQGIDWLAGREEMSDPDWRGSWRYAYSSSPPYAAMEISPGEGVRDVRGVSATSALFVYLLYLHKELSGSDELVEQYAENARAALDFIGRKNRKNREEDGFALSSWQQDSGTLEWKRWDYQYTADQIDVFLGFTAGGALYDATGAYQQTADFLRQQAPLTFFMPSLEHYALGRDLGGQLEFDLEEFNGIFPQGYLPWVLGPGTENDAAHAWLASNVQDDGSVSGDGGNTKYAASAAMYILASISLGKPMPETSRNWLLSSALDSSGGVYDTDTDQTMLSNVAGFTLMALLGTPPILPR